MNANCLTEFIVLLFKKQPRTMYQLQMTFIFHFVNNKAVSSKIIAHAFKNRSYACSCSELHNTDRRELSLLTDEKKQKECD